MKNSSERKQGRAFFGLLVCLVILASCTNAPPHNREVGTFHPEQVSCDIRVKSDPQAIVDEAFKKHSEGDLYGMAHADAILVDLKALADQGNPGGMFFVGALQREVIVLKLHGEKSRPAKRFFPDDFHDIIVTALTYVYLSSGIDSEYRQKALEEEHRIEANKSDLMTPLVWIEEAKANVRNWTAYCAAQNAGTM